MTFRRTAPYVLLAIVIALLDVVEEERPAAPRPRVVVRAPPPVIMGEPRRVVREALAAESFVGGWVQDAMAKPGDSDPRLLRALGTLGVWPSAFAGVGAAIDPWLAAGLVDLDRQIARRCVSEGWDTPEGCFLPVVEVEEEIAAMLGDEPAGEAVSWFLEHDREHLR